MGMLHAGENDGSFYRRLVGFRDSVVVERVMINVRSINILSF